MEVECASKAEWRKQINAPTFPVNLRSLRWTLSKIARLMSTEGELAVWFPQIVHVTGLPLRSVERHIARAVEAGWLTHTVRGGKGRKSRYAASTPVSVSGRPPVQADSDAMLSPPPMADLEPELTAVQYGQPMGFSPPASGGVKEEDRASVSEHKALQQPTTTPADTPTSAAKGERQGLADEELPAWLSADVGSPLYGNDKPPGAYGPASMSPRAETAREPPSVRPAEDWVECAHEGCLESVRRGGPDWVFKRRVRCESRLRSVPTRESHLRSLSTQPGKVPE